MPPPPSPYHATDPSLLPSAPLSLLLPLLSCVVALGANNIAGTQPRDRIALQASSKFFCSPARAETTSARVNPGKRVATVIVEEEEETNGGSKEERKEENEERSMLALATGSV